MTKWERRRRRESQQKYRKLGPSPATIFENTQVVLCVQWGRISEIEGARILRVRLDQFRKIEESAITLATVVAEKLSKDEDGI